MPSTRTGTPRAAATASSMLANSSGRAIASIATHDGGADRGGGCGLRALQAEDRAEQHVDARRCRWRRSREVV